MTMTKTELLEAADDVTGGEDLKHMPLDEVERLITMAQYIFDICVNELEERGELAAPDGRIGVPYVCDYMVPTVLNGLVPLTRVQ